MDKKVMILTNILEYYIKVWNNGLFQNFKIALLQLENLLNFNSYLLSRLFEHDGFFLH